MNENETIRTNSIEDAPIQVEETSITPVDYETLYKGEKHRSKIMLGTGVAIGTLGTVLYYKKFRKPMQDLRILKKAKRLEKKAAKGNSKAREALVKLCEENPTLLKGLIDNPEA